MERNVKVYTHTYIHNPDPNLNMYKVSTYIQFILTLTLIHVTPLDKIVINIIFKGPIVPNQQTFEILLWASKSLKHTILLFSINTGQFLIC